MRSFLFAALSASSFALLLACSGDDNKQTTSDAGADAGMGADADAMTPDTGPGFEASCPQPVPPDPLATQRAACMFTAGAKVRDTIGIGDAERAAIPVKHVVVLMKENRSFDQILGKLHDQGQPGTEAIPPTFSNKDAMNADVSPYHETSTCVEADPAHQWAQIHSCVNGGKMDGFVTNAAASTGTDGHFVMGYFDQTDLPFDYFIAKTYALNDRHFASVRSGTFPNRNFLLLGTAAGIMSTGTTFPDPSIPTIFDSLDKAGVTWGVYSDGSLLGGTLPWSPSHTGAHPFGDFIKALDDGTLPSVAFVDGIDYVEDEHPPANLQQGEAWTKNIYDHALASKLWPSLAMFWTYDEGGAMADHVPPPNTACVARPGDEAFVELGPRVPFVAISPWARPGYVSHVSQEHTAITRFIETVFDLPALTARDANSDALLDLFDFGCPHLLTPPAAPAAGKNGCYPGVTLMTDKSSYKVGETVLVSFSGGPGNSAKDWIAIYPFSGGMRTTPQYLAVSYNYIGGTHMPTTSPTSGTVPIDATAKLFPLAAGQYTAYYLLDNSYTEAAATDFTVTP